MSAGELKIKKSKQGSLVREITKDFNIYCQSIPFKMFGESKELASNNWNDENGLDVYIPDTIRMSSYDLEVKFVFKGRLSDASSAIKTFIGYLTGKDGSGASLSIYDPYYKIGRKDICYKSAADEAELKEYKEGNEKMALVEFSVTFQVNDPVTDVVL